MEDFGCNYRGGRAYVPCPLCSEHEDSQENSFYKCKILSKTIDVKGRYEDIFDLINTDINQLTTTITKITSTRKDLIIK